MNDDQVLTIEEAAQFLKMTPRQVYEFLPKTLSGADGAPVPSVLNPQQSKACPQIGPDGVDSKACCEGSDAKAVASPESGSTLHDAALISLAYPCIFQSVHPI
jgi:hypothetical protein